MKDVLLKIVDELELIATHLGALEKISTADETRLDLARGLAAKDVQKHFDSIRAQVREALK